MHGGADSELLQLNEGSVWSGRAADVEKPEVLQNLPRLRELLFAGKNAEAEALAKRMEEKSKEFREKGGEIYQ